MSGQYSEPPSGPTSDDEGVGAAVNVGGHLRTSPAHLGSGHESESSNTESISGRSSAYGGDGGRVAAAQSEETGAATDTPAKTDGAAREEGEDSGEIEYHRRSGLVKLYPAGRLQPFMKCSLKEQG